MIIKTLLTIAGLGLFFSPTNTAAATGVLRTGKKPFSITENPINRKHRRMLAKLNRN